jgi:molybdopterin-guanine dinucleotide biosynthesis protein A
MNLPVGVILAGGQATRMGGGDKGRLMLGQQSLLEHVIDRLRPQVSSIILNANGLQVCLQGWIGLLKMVQSLL